jgi:hypothetical protein
MAQSQKVTVNVSLPPRQTNYRVVRQPVRPSSSFVPNQPVRISPPEFRLMAPPNVLQSSQYAQAAAVLADQGTQAIKAGTMRTCKDIAQPWFQPNNPNDIAPYSGSKRLTPTMDYNAPVNSRLVSGDIPPTLSQFQGGLGPLQEGSTTAVLKPESVTRHLYSSEKYESSMGMAPVSAQAAFSQAPAGYLSSDSLKKSLERGERVASSLEPNPAKDVLSPKKMLRPMKPEPSGYAGAPGAPIHPRVVFEEEKAYAYGGVF